MSVPVIHFPLSKKHLLSPEWGYFSQILTLMGENKSTIEPIITMNEEQSKISRNLHDGVAQDLAALKLYL